MGLDSKVLSYNGLEFECFSSKNVVNYVDSHKRLKRAGFDGHISSRSLFGFIVDGLEDRLVDSGLKQLSGLFCSGSVSPWLDVALVRDGGFLFCYSGVRGLVFDGGFYFKGSDFVFDDVHTFNVGDLSKNVPLKSFSDDFVRFVYGFSFIDLPKKIQDEAVIRLPSEPVFPRGTIWPASLHSGYGLAAYKSVSDSFGVIGDKKRVVEYKRKVFSENIDVKLESKIQSEPFDTSGSVEPIKNSTQRAKITVQAKKESKQDATMPPEKSPIIMPSLFFIEEFSDRYRLHNVQCFNELWVFDWSKKYLYDGKPHTQKEFVDLTQNEEFKLPPAPVHISSIIALYENQNGSNAQQKSLVEKVKTMIQEDFKRNDMMTSTQVTYSRNSPDIIKHWYGYNNETQMHAEIVGPDGYLETRFEEATDALLGTKDVQKLITATEWLTDKKPYFWRLNQRLNRRQEERALVIRCCLKDFDIINRYGIWYGCARGIIARRTRKNP